MANSLPHELSGNKASDTLLVFMHGYPDTTAVWDGIIPSFEQENYVLNVSYPNYSQKEINPKGIDFDELVDRLKVTINQVNDSNRKVVAVIHDWGSIYVLCLITNIQGFLTRLSLLMLVLRLQEDFIISFVNLSWPRHF